MFEYCLYDCTGPVFRTRSPLEDYLYTKNKCLYMGRYMGRLWKLKSWYLCTGNVSRTRDWDPFTVGTLVSIIKFLVPVYRTRVQDPCLGPFVPLEHSYQLSQHFILYYLGSINLWKFERSEWKLSSECQCTGPVKLSSC